MTYRVDGLLHLTAERLLFEWQLTRRTQHVSFTAATTEIESRPAETIEVPVNAIASAQLLGAWWWPRLELRARNLDTFAALPTSRPAAITLRVRRRDRRLAASLVEALAAMGAGAALPDSRIQSRLPRAGEDAGPHAT